MFGFSSEGFFPITYIDRSIVISQEDLDVIFSQGTPRSNRITVYTGGKYKSRDSGTNEFTDMSRLTNRFDDV